MKRRELLTTMVASGLAVPAAAAQTHGHGSASGPLATTTVSFGFWPLGNNRFATPNAPVAPNGHAMVPYEATVKAGGTVNFVVAGLHLIAIYQPGTTTEDIDPTLLAPPVPGLPGPPMIDDPNGRVYFGLDPRRVPVMTGLTPPNYLQDRVEVVHFPDAGRYLVICAVLPHFVPPPSDPHGPMHGWVRVVP